MCKTVEAVLPEDAKQVKMMLAADLLPGGKYSVGYVIDVPDDQTSLFDDEE